MMNRELTQSQHFYHRFHDGVQFNLPLPLTRWKVKPIRHETTNKTVISNLKRSFKVGRNYVQKSVNVHQARYSFDVGFQWAKDLLEQSLHRFVRRIKKAFLRGTIIADGSFSGNCQRT